ncbi:MAG: hypothetical protein JKZ02_13675, partial [Erythrobacter sp.]|nr:hypothetical protein [Erythrobacter sp.]
ESVRDGTETLAYTYRMQKSLHPRDHYRADLAALRRRRRAVLASLASPRRAK